MPTTHEKPRRTPFGQWLYSARKGIGLSMRALAERADVTHAHISNLEAGRASPSREMVERLAMMLVSNDGLTSEEIQEAEKRIRSTGLRAAGFLEDESRDPIISIAREAGYDNGDVSAEDMDDLREDVKDFIRARLESKRRKRQQGR